MSAFSIVPLNEVCDFYHAAATILDWGHLDDKVVMDIGCGQGYSSRSFARIFPKIRRLIAIDIVSERLDEAKERNSHPKVEYIQADITNKNTFDSWIGRIDVAVSVFCFNCFKDQKKGFENLFRLLKDTGHAAILQGLYSSILDLLLNMFKLPKWSSYKDNAEVFIPESHYKKYNALHYRKLFEEIGFEVVECADHVKTHAYKSDEECRDSIFKSCPLSASIPDERKLEFKSDLFETFVKHNPRNDDGLLYMTHCSLSALLRKIPGPSKSSGESEK